jgi:hypothetical protein
MGLRPQTQERSLIKEDIYWNVLHTSGGEAERTTACDRLALVNFSLLLGDAVALLDNLNRDDR